MPIQYRLEEMFGENGNNKYHARSKPESILSEEQIIDRLSYGSSFTKADITGIWQLIVQVFREEFEKGNAIRTPLGKFTPTLTGKFATQTERFNPNKQSIRIKYTPSLIVTKDLQTAISVKKIDFTNRQPKIDKILNISYPEKKKFSNLEIAEILGIHLKITPDFPETGITLVQKSQEVPIPTKCLHVTENRRIQFQLQDIPPGIYTIRITSKVGSAIRTTQSGIKIQIV
jgi:predicted histone-like DNA-binding protein